MRLKELNDAFAISVGAFSIMDNHLHVVLRIEVEMAAKWSEVEVVRRWYTLFPPKDKKRRLLLNGELEQRIIDQSNDAKWVSRIRDRLASISWYMKSLKEPLARLANKVDGCKGAFFEGRFKSIAILDDQSLLMALAYVDLNPVAAGLSTCPEESKFTSIKLRVDHVKFLGRIDELINTRGIGISNQSASTLEDKLWLAPIDVTCSAESGRDGILCGCTLGDYVMFVDETGRQPRAGKCNISAELGDIFKRLKVSVDQLESTLQSLSQPQLIGRYMASSRTNCVKLQTDATCATSLICTVANNSVLLFEIVSATRVRRHNLKLISVMLRTFYLKFH